jgi:hypothetical protein
MRQSSLASTRRRGQLSGLEGGWEDVYKPIRLDDELPKSKGPGRGGNSQCMQPSCHFFVMSG